MIRLIHKFCYSDTSTTLEIAKKLHRSKKALILLTSSTDKNPPQAGRAYKRREIITALAITDSWASGRPWWRRSLSRYSLCAHCDKMNWMCESILMRPFSTGWLKLQDWTMADRTMTDRYGQLIVISYNYRALLSIDWYVHYNSFESVLCLKTYEIHTDKQKLWTCNRCYLASCLLALKCVK